MSPRTPVILIVAGEQQSEVRDQFAHRYAVDYDLQVVSSLSEAMVTAQSLISTHTPVAMFVALHKVPDATGLVTVQCLHAVIPSAKRVVLWTRESGRMSDELREAQANGGLEAALLLPNGPRDEEFHSAVTELLSDWGWTTGGPEVDWVTVVSDTATARIAEIRDFLDRQGIPFSVVAPDHPRAEPVLAQVRGRGEDPAYPVVKVADHEPLVRPTNREIARSFGHSVDELGADHLVDLAIVGGGPSGLAAAVYGASEGLDTVLIEADAIGGQAGTSSMIRNYLGFPRGISGMRLAQRARFQANRFGARLFGATPVESFEPGLGGKPHTLHTPDGPVRARTVLVASGVTYQRLGVENVENLVGMGVYYGAAPSAAREYAGKDVVVVGGGNSAGQAAVHLSRFARTVSIHVRRDGLAETMSDYLIREINNTPRIIVRPRTQVIDAGGEPTLEWLTVRNLDTCDEKKIAVQGLFLLLGAHPRSDWLGACVKRDDKGFIYTGRDVPKGHWIDGLPPQALATSLPGVFAVGDGRHGSMKRVASAAGEGAAAIPLIHEYLAGQR